MNWSQPADLRAQVQRLWQRGDLLRAVVAAAGGRFPTPPADAALCAGADANAGAARVIADTTDTTGTSDTAAAAPWTLTAHLAERAEGADAMHPADDAESAAPMTPADTGAPRADATAVDATPALRWPLRLPLKAPGAADVANRFEAVRAWAQALAELQHVRLEWRTWQHRVQGRQRLPAALWLDSPAAACALIGQGAAAQRFLALWQATAAAQPALLAWLWRRPQQALQALPQWQRLLAVVAWLQARPRPAVYLRQVDVPGVDSKFIEAHRGLLAELLNLALPAQAIDATAQGTGEFHRRFGFLHKPQRLRLRLLDPALPSLPGCRGLADITLDAASFASLALPLQRVFITENETDFLAFPAQPRAIVLFGAGYGWDPLARAAWLHACALHYWGDIDTHGFGILSQLRAAFPHAASLLMDRATLLAHRAHWGEEAQPRRDELPRLTPAEAALYDALRFDQLQPRLRLEQERIGYGWVCERLARLG